MEIADVRKRILSAIERGKQRAADRRTRNDEAARAYSIFLDTIAVPLFRQAGNVLRAEGHQFSVSTPSGSVRLMSDRTAEDFVEIVLDTSGDIPRVMGRSSRGRGRRVVESERPVGDPAALTDHDLLDFLVREIDALIER